MTSYRNLTYVTIGGVDVSAYVIDWDASEDVTKNVDDAKITVSKNILAVSSLVSESEVIIQRGKTTGQENYVFRGFLREKNTKDLQIDLTCKNKLAQLEKRTVLNIYDKDIDAAGGVLSAISEDLMETYGGMNATVTDSSSYSRALDVYPCYNDTVLERVEKLREVLNWILRYDYENDNAVLEPKGTTVNSNVLRYTTNTASGTSNILATPVWQEDAENLINEVTVIGRGKEDIKTETFSGNGSTTDFTLASVPNQTEVFVGGVKKVLGIAGASSTYDYTVSQHLKKISFVTAPASGTDNITVNYGATTPVTIVMQDADSIDTYSPTDPSTGEKVPFQRTFQYEDVVTIADAEQRALEILERYSTPILKTQVPIAQLDTAIKAGESIRVIDEVNDVDDFFIVTEIAHQWPDIFDIITLGQERVFETDNLIATEDRLAKLEKREYRNIELINHNRPMDKAIRLSAYVEVLRTDTSGQGAWNKGFTGSGVTSGTLPWDGTGAVWSGTSSSATTTTVAVVWPDNKYEESFQDTNFYNSGSSSNVTIDTSAFTATWTDTGTLALGPVHKGIGGTLASPTTISSVKIVSPPARWTGTPTALYARTSTSNAWESVSGVITGSSGVTHTFTGTAGSEVHIAYSAGSGVVLSGSSSGRLYDAVTVEVLT